MRTQAMLSYSPMAHDFAFSRDRDRCSSGVFECHARMILLSRPQKSLIPVHSSLKASKEFK